MRFSNAFRMLAAPSSARLSCEMRTATEREGAVVGGRGCADPGTGADTDVVAWGLAVGIVPVHHTSSAGAAPTGADSFCETTVATAHYNRKFQVFVRGPVSRVGLGTYGDCTRVSERKGPVDLGVPILIRARARARTHGYVFWSVYTGWQRSFQVACSRFFATVGRTTAAGERRSSSMTADIGSLVIVFLSVPCLLIRLAMAALSSSSSSSFLPMFNIPGIKKSDPIRTPVHDTARYRLRRVARRAAAGGRGVGQRALE